MGLTKIISDLQNDEGFRSKVYLDTEGNPTIGYGFLIRDLELTKDIAGAILLQIVLKRQKEIRELMPWTSELPDPIFDAVTEMVYQMGPGEEDKNHEIKHGFRSFKKAIGHLQKQEWQLAADDFMQGLWAKQTPNRAKKVTNMIRHYTP